MTYPKIVGQIRGGHCGHECVCKIVELFKGEKCAHVRCEYRSHPYQSEQDRVLEQNIDCFGEYQMNLKRCLSCIAGSHCYDKREELRQAGEP